MKASISMITRSISVALLVSAVPSVHAATSWMEARGDAMGGSRSKNEHPDSGLPRRGRDQDQPGPGPVGASRAPAHLFLMPGTSAPAERTMLPG